MTPAYPVSLRADPGDRVHLLPLERACAGDSGVIREFRHYVTFLVASTRSDVQAMTVRLCAHGLTTVWKVAKRGGDGFAAAPIRTYPRQQQVEQQHKALKDGELSQLKRLGDCCPRFDEVSFG